MHLKAFHVQMYRGVIDSGWIEVESLTSLVGKNESGKTTLLRALHKLNPFSPEPYVMAREWPRGHRKERSDTQVVCTARFALTESETSASALTKTDPGVLARNDPGGVASGRAGFGDRPRRRAKEATVLGVSTLVLA